MKTLSCCGHDSNPIYSVGFIGATVYFISQATSFGAGIVAIFKAMVWPAFLVYYAFKFFLG